MATVHCPHCYSDTVYRSGLIPAKRERFRCQPCRRVFQPTYSYEARKRGVTEQIVDMAFNGASVQDPAWTLKIGFNTDFKNSRSGR